MCIGFVLCVFFYFVIIILLAAGECFLSSSLLSVSHIVSFLVISHVAHYIHTLHVCNVCINVLCTVNTRAL